MAQEMIPLLAVRSVDFEKDLKILKQIMGQLEARTHSENAFRFSERAEMAAGWWFYDILVSPEFLQKIFQLLLPPGSPRNKKSASIKIVDMLQDQLKKSGSSAWVKMHGDMPFAAPWWAWLMR
jgi:hypothetical protein